ncbi:MAG: ferritin-like domain-containing protein [Thermosynechococcaceae cyanobacterium MS004]|nr:ferritin-like domain-containing protein [Thermosynechococcaceae cyanobacterium MS004]
MVNIIQMVSRSGSQGGLFKDDSTINPGFRQTHQQLQRLIQQYLNQRVLCDRLEDLPRQFQVAQPRPWRPIHWKSIDASQIVGIDPLIFIAILAGAADTEHPIRDYTQTSRQYLAPLHPAMAKFVGGTTDAQGTLLEPGLWEKEERQHSPALQKLYTQFTGLKLRVVPHEARSYQPFANPELDLYHHGLHRIATEYGATCLYLWLTAHSVGQLRAVFEELLIDEINHMTKFWGYGRWAYPSVSCFNLLNALLSKALTKIWHREASSLLHTLRRMTQVLHWEAWSFKHKATFLWTLILSLQQMYQWSHSLSPEYLESLFGRPHQSEAQAPSEAQDPKFRS